MLYFLFSTPAGYNLNHLGVIIANGLLGLDTTNITLPIMLAFLLLALFCGYILGSINSALILSGKMYGEDIRTVGSGNAGFTNMMRNYGGRAAYLTFVFDFIKTAVALMIGWVLFGYIGAWTAALGAVFGHIFPLYYNFRGGKGIVCLTATVFMLDWRVFAIEFVVFMVVALSTRFVSLASTISAATIPLFVNRMAFVNKTAEGTIIDENSRLKAVATAVSLIIAVVIVIKHIPNIKRIREGKEGKFTFNKSKKKFEEEQKDGNK